MSPFVIMDDMIEYSDEKSIDPQALEALFSSLDWESAKFPDRLARALCGYGTVFSAWQNGELVGLIATMDDGELNAYIHYLLVRPDCQGLGIGKELLRRTKAVYRNYFRIVLSSYVDAVGFYRSQGFSVFEGEVPMVCHPTGEEK